jgi:hypothetical protein
LTLLLSSTIFTPFYSKAINNNIMFFKNNSVPYGTPYSEWPKIWWQYWLGIPNNEHPGTDYASKKCPIHQQGPVWFLPDVISKGNQVAYTLRQFSCEIPKDKAIYFPLSTGACWLGLIDFKDVSNKLAADPKNDAALKSCAVSPQDNTQILYVRINGTDLDTSKLGRATTSFFNLTLPPNPVTDIFQGIQSGTSRAIADGYFLFLNPLPTGTYLVDFKVVDHVAGPDSPAQTREGQYTVIVK